MTPHSSAKSRNRPVGLAFIGPLTPEYKKLLPYMHVQAREGNIELRVLDRLLSNEEMNAAIVALDCVVMAYSTHAPNSTLGKAAALGVRLVGAGSSSIQSFVREMGYSSVCALNPSDLSASLLVALRSVPPEARTDLGSHEFCRILVGDTRKSL